ncbi:MAG: site-2 protease family protein [Candidatus Aminicenantes bacterium]|nr:MAG: site-2 protease family protein [Candidatus Aminicenantes bacterium]
MEEMEEEKRLFTFFVTKRIWLNLLLFAVTAVSTFVVGFSWSIGYKYAELFSQNPDLVPDAGMVLNPEIVALSLIYTFVLLGILLGHELGHFLLCQHYNIDATLPYFIPAPTLIGTMGAFIRIRSPITKKQQLFDIGIAGPLTSFILSLPAIVLGLFLSKAVPSLPEDESLLFGDPLIFKFVGNIVFKDTPQGFDIVPHPIAFAGWVGILVTALNLFPIGQLDGGHVTYALFGKKSLKLAPYIIGIFVLMGIFFWIGWFVWALLIYFLGLKHPRIFDEDIPLSPKRRLLSVLALFIFVVSFTPEPIMGYNLFDLLKQLAF